MGKKTVNEGYIPGDYFMECDRCGLSYRRSDLVRDGYVKGLMVCRSCWDFKATYPSPPPDRIAVPVPRPDNTTVSANNITWNYTSIGDNLFPDPWCVKNLIEYSDDYTKWDTYEAFSSPVTVDGSGYWTIPANGAVVFYYRDVEKDDDTYYSLGGDFDITQGEATLGIFVGSTTVIGQESFTASGTYSTSAEVEPGGIPAGDPEMRLVVCNLSSTDVIIKCTNMRGNIGADLVEVDWTGGVASQDHVKYYSHSLLIEDEAASIGVSGLTIGTEYRFMCSSYIESGYIEIDIGSDKLKIFERPQLHTWVEDYVLFKAESTSIILSVAAYGKSYVDGFYVQEYINEDRFLSNSEILENKKPPVDSNTDNTITPDPLYIGYSDNIFPDPDVSEIPTEFEAFPEPQMSVERSTTQYNTGTHSLKAIYSGAGVFFYGGGKYEVDADTDTEYRFKFHSYVQRPLDAICALFGSEDIYTNPIVNTPNEDVWIDSGYYEFTTPSEITNSNIYFGVSYLTGTISLHNSYYDTFTLNKYINQTTPF